MATETASDEYRAFRRCVLERLLSKGWKKLLAKRIRYEQSLFEHSVNTLDIVLTCLPILRQSWHPRLSPAEGGSV